MSKLCPRDELCNSLVLRSVLYQQYPTDKLLVVLCGLPGAGKTTLANALSARITRSAVSIGSIFPFHRAVTVEYDAIHTDNFSDLRSEAEREIERELQNAGVVISDDNQYYKSMRKPFKRMAQRYQSGYLLLYLQIPRDIAIKRNATRKEERQVPVDVIERMDRRLEVPDESECLALDGTNILSTNVEMAFYEGLRRAIEPPLPVAPASGPEPLTEKAVNELERRKRVREAVLEARRRGATPQELKEIANGGIVLSFT